MLSCYMLSQMKMPHQSPDLNIMFECQGLALQNKPLSQNNMALGNWLKFRDNSQLWSVGLLIGPLFTSPVGMCSTTVLIATEPPPSGGDLWVFYLLVHSHC